MIRILSLMLALSFGILILQEGHSRQYEPQNNPIKSYSPIGDEKMAKGLKDALEKGSKEAVKELNQENGYYKDEVVKIPFPPKAQKMADKLRESGMDKQVDDLVKKINRAAEDAAEKAKPIFVDAITNMSIQDAASILKGKDTAATHYFRNNTQDQLFKTFKPDIEKSLEDVGAQDAWESVSKTYNKVAMFSDPVETDLAAYTTQRALDGLFYKVKQEEKKIREDPVARTTDVLKDVFGGLGGG